MYIDAEKLFGTIAIHPGLRYVPGTESNQADDVSPDGMLVSHLFLVHDATPSSETFMTDVILDVELKQPWKKVSKAATPWEALPSIGLSGSTSSAVSHSLKEAIIRAERFFSNSTTKQMKYTVIIGSCQVRVLLDGSQEVDPI